MGISRSQNLLFQITGVVVGETDPDGKLKPNGAYQVPFNEDPTCCSLQSNLKLDALYEFNQLVDIVNGIEEDLGLNVDTYEKLIDINHKIIGIQERFLKLITTSWWESDSEKVLKDIWMAKYKSIISAYKKVEKDDAGFLQFSYLMNQIPQSEIRNSNTENGLKQP